MCQKEKLKIGICCYPSVGGSGVVATELGKMLAANGHEIHFITSSIPFRLNKMVPNIYFHQVEVNSYSVFQYPPYDLALAGKISEVVETANLDIVHVHYAMPHAVCAILAQQMCKKPFKIVTTLHGTDITVLGYDSSLKQLVKFGIEKSDVVTAVSQSLVEDTKRLIGPEKEMEVVYNFIDEDVYHCKRDTTLKQKYGIHKETNVFIHISNFRPVKRVEDVVKVFKNVADHTDSVLLLVGDGPDILKVKEMVSTLKLVNKVLFLGKQDNVAELLQMSDLMLLLSEKEAFGLVLLEAMACGVPCVGTNIGGIPEVIRHNETGLIYPVGDIEGISNGCIELISDKERLNEYRKNGCELVRNYFSSKEIVNQYEDIYYKVVGRERP